MNIISDAVADFGALPILDKDRDQYHKSVRSFQAHRVHDERRRVRMWFWIAMAEAVLIVSLAGNLNFLLPIKTLVPLPLAIHEDGTVDTGVALSDLGADQAEKVIRSSIWRYVAERESYSFSDAKYRYDLVSLMSSDSVRHDYQTWFIKSPDAPQQMFGKNGQVSVHEISMSLVREGVFLIRFWRISQRYGEKERKTSATATVEFELLNAAPASLILDDPAALQVVRYHVDEEGAV